MRLNSTLSEPFLISDTVPHRAQTVHLQVRSAVTGCRSNCRRGARHHRHASQESRYSSHVLRSWSLSLSLIARRVCNNVVIRLSSGGVSQTQKELHHIGDVCTKFQKKTGTVCACPSFTTHTLTHRTLRPAKSNSTPRRQKQTLPPGAVNQTRRPTQHALVQLSPAIHHETYVTTESNLLSTTPTRTSPTSDSQATSFSSAAHSSTRPPC